MRETASQIRATTETQHARALAVIEQATMRTLHRRPRAAEGRKHSAETQSHLDQAATHAAAVTAHLKSVDATPADLNEEDPFQGSEKLSTNASFAERYKAGRLKDMAIMRTAERKIRADIAANPPRLRVLEEPDAVPTAWDAALADRQPNQHDITPDCWPGYSRENPPNGYALALAMRQLQEAK